MITNAQRRMSPIFYGENEEILAATFCDVRKGHREKSEYIVRSSPLDDFFEKTTLSKSLFVGIYHLMMVMIMVYVFNQLFIRIVDKKTPLDLDLFYKLEETSVPLIVAFLICSIYIFVGFFMHKLVVITNMNTKLAKFISYFAVYSILFIPLWIRFHFQ